MEILGKYRILDVESYGSKGLKSTCDMGSIVTREIINDIT